MDALSRLRVLDLSDERGFLAGKILGDLGADVIKVEPPDGDPSRGRGPFLHAEPGRERSLPWMALNTSKRGITLELESREGREIFRRLSAGSDVVLESFEPGALERCGLGFESLREENAGLVMCAMTPFGQDGPYAAYEGHDLVIVAMGGNQAMTGDAARPPLRCSMPTSTYHAAPEAVLGILMALYAREETGRGDYVDVSMHECQLATLISGPGQHALSGRLGKRAGAYMGRTREIWPTKDGYVSFGLRGGPSRIPNLVATVEYMAECGAAPDWLRDYDWQQYSHITASDEELARLEEAFGGFFRFRSMRELYDEALARRILLAPCNDAREILEQPQLRERELFVTLEYPELGASIEHPDFFARAGLGRIGIRWPAPRVGEHNGEIFGELGLDARELERLAREGVI
ncbi:MAG: CoA transferase [Deltaproteobacteria bacterium]|nr:CoA transferase [Deltaproteobacteria bacterium]MBW2418069.1 CoA transferase [Deltaproteobacteria bacterium]